MLTFKCETMDKPKNFYELLDMEFIIPPYQRGYRWEEEQVVTLLDDLYDFIKSIKARKSSSCTDSTEPYYCLQPITVVKVSENPKRYVVVDGQQRLTTVYLLLHFLRNEEWRYNIYTLSMPNRDAQNKYLKDEEFKIGNGGDYNNIDIFYLQKAYEAIKAWFSKEDSEQKKRAQEKESFRKLFAYVPDAGEPVNNVRVIWYEIEDQTALDAFRRLNYGKIPLTSTELVKALLLKGNTNPNVGEYSKGAAYRRALEWDSMEHALHNPYLWSMIAEPTANSQSHLDIVLDFVSDQLNDKMADPETLKKPFVRKDEALLVDRDARDYFNYNVVNEFLHREKEKGVDIVWNEIRKTFNLVSNWYDNREWYHLIGLLRILPRKRKSQLDFFRYVYNLSVDEGKENKPVDRPSFTKRLEQEIGEMVKLNRIELDSLSYNDHNDKIIQILKMLNVKEAMDDTTEGNRFAFHLFDSYNVTSLEHIHPQNITTEATYEDFCEWLNRRAGDFENLKDADFIKAVTEREGENLDNERDSEKLRKRAHELREDAKNALEVLKKLTETKASYGDENNKETLDSATKTLDKLYGDLSGIKESELHSISNLALVDQPTNSALQNFFLDKKRDLLMCRHNASDSEGAERTYAPPATRRVFCKEYSRFSPGDMRLWRREDREKYYKRIEEVYKYFTCI